MKVILNVVLRKHISNENCDCYFKYYRIKIHPPLSLWQKDSIKCNTAKSTIYKNHVNDETGTQRC